MGHARRKTGLKCARNHPRRPVILAGGVVPKPCHGKQSHLFMHVADWMATLAAVAGVPATALAHANASGPKPLDSFNMAPMLFGGTCGADRAASPRTSLMYFCECRCSFAPLHARCVLALHSRMLTVAPLWWLIDGDDNNGAYASGDYKLGARYPHSL